MKEKGRSLRVSDLLFNVLRKNGKMVRWIYWKSLLGKLGNGSFIRNSVQIVGNPKRVMVGDRFQIWHRCFINVGSGSVSFGNDGHLGVDVYINASKGNVTIGDHVAIAPKTQIYSYSDTYRPNKLIGDVHEVGDVRIGNNILIGSGAILLPGVCIGDGAVVAAGAVVTKDVGEFEIVAGIPAKKIKDRPR